MAMTAAELVKADQEHLIHPLHHPIDNAEPLIYVRGRGAMIQEIGGHEYIDGLSGLWNVNVGHGRTELADAAAAQMKDLAYFSGYVGSSSWPTTTCRPCSSPAAAPSRTSRRSRRRASTGRRRASPTRSRSSRASRAITASPCRR